MVGQLKLLWIEDMVCMLNKSDSLFHGKSVIKIIISLRPSDYK